jgi:hypothetical protein
MTNLVIALSLNRLLGAHTLATLVTSRRLLLVSMAGRKIQTMVRACETCV